MNYRKIAAVTASIIVLCGSYSCGKSGSSSESTSSVSGTSVSSENETASSADNDNNSGSGSDDEAEKTTSAEETTSPDDGSSNEKPTSTDKDTETKVTTTKKPDDKPAETTTTKAGGGSSAETPTEPSTEKEYTAKITLGSSISAEGKNVTVSGSTVKITAGGTYYVKGSSSQGQIVVDTKTEDKLKLVLDGVELTNANGPAIFINEAKRCTVELAAGTTNILKDGGKDKVNDGVIFSNDTLRIKGTGKLSITAVNAHGIASDDDVIIEDGNIDITSKKSGIFAHDDITIEGGNITVKGGTNGLKSKGSIHINGGNTVASGGTKEEKSSVYATSAFVYKGGVLCAAGNQVTKPSSAANPYVIAEMKSSASAGTKVTMTADGKQIGTLTPHNNFRFIIMLSPDIKSGGKFTVEVGGEKKEFTVESGFNHPVIG